MEKIDTDYRVNLETFSPNFSGKVNRDAGRILDISVLKIITEL